MSESSRENEKTGYRAQEDDLEKPGEEGEESAKPVLTATAFKWTGTWYNATYNTSHEVSFHDEDGAYGGFGDSDERVSIDGAGQGTTVGQPYAIKVDFTDTAGNPHVETFHFFATSGGWYFIPGPGSAFSEGAHLGSYQSHTVGWDYDDIVCFAAGTLIDTEAGPVPVEALCPGSPVRVAGTSGAAPLRLNLRRALSGLELLMQPKLRPVRIRRGALGPDLPNRDLLVSRQHRMLVASPVCRRMFGCDEVLVPAIRLVGLPGCSIDPAPKGVAWHHLVFDRHQIVFANGAPSESFLPGPQAMQTIPVAARAELLALFPTLATPGGGFDPARPIPVAKAQRRLIDRHRKNALPLLANWHAAAA